MGADVVWIESHAETRGHLAMLLAEAVGLDTAGVEVVELAEAGEGNVRRPWRCERIERPRDLKTMIVAVGVDRVSEPRFPVRCEERRVGIRDSEAGAIDAVFPSQFEIFAKAEEV